MSEALFVALEGLSCTGKSTVCNPLAELLGAIVLPTIPDEYASLRKHLAGHDLIDARFLLFLSAIMVSSRAIRETLARGCNVVAESYSARTVAFHRGMGSSIDVALPKLIQPDVTFRLTCDESLRALRARSRGGTRHYWDLLAEAHRKEILEEYRKFPHHVIDTTDLPPPGVARQIMLHSLDGNCSCENGQRLAGCPNLLSAVHN